MPCHTAFVLKEPLEIGVVAEGIRNSDAEPVEFFHRREGSSGQMQTDGMTIDEVVYRYESIPAGRITGASGPRRITAFRVRGVVSVQSLGPLASSVRERLVIHQTAVLTAPNLSGDPPVHVVKSFGTC